MLVIGFARWPLARLFYFCLGRVILGIYLPPKLFRKIGSLVAHTAQVVEILGRYRLEEHTHPRHSERLKAIAHPRAVEHLHKVEHELAALGGALFFADYPFDMSADVLHTSKVYATCDKIYMKDTCE